MPAELLFPIDYPTVAVAGSEARFPVHRIYCIGQNYAAHAREMGNDPERESPVWFMKAADSVVPSGSKVDYPPRTSDLHHEIELVVALRDGGRDISIAKASGLIYGYAVGIDMTRRDLQGQAKKMGRPWEVGKAFECSAPCSEVVPAAETGPIERGAVWLKVNGAMRQEGDLNQLIWKIPEMIGYLSGLFTLRPGDLIFTGTPAGVGPVQRGDALHGGVDGVGEVRVNVV